MLKRTISGVVMAIIIAATIFWGAIPFGVLLMLASLISIYEMSKAIGIHDDKKKINILELFLYTGVLALYLTSFLSNRDSIDRNVLSVIIVVILLILAAFVFAYPKYHTTQIAGSVFILLYAPLMLSFGYRIEAFSTHPYIYTALIFIIACGSDVSAYFVGSTFGKHKLAPVLSPKKSIEGAVGAIVITALMCVIYGVVLGSFQLIDTRLSMSLGIIGAIGSVISQIGDLAASAIKRNYNIKDYGKFIPGHGGIMDRVDSWIVVMPIIYLLLRQ